MVILEILNECADYDFVAEGHCPDGCRHLSKKNCLGLLLKHFVTKLSLPVQLFIEDQYADESVEDCYLHGQFLSDVYTAVDADIILAYKGFFADVRRAYSTELTPEEKAKYGTYESLQEALVLNYFEVWDSEDDTPKLYRQTLKSLRDLGTNEELVRLHLVWRSRHRDDISWYGEYSESIEVTVEGLFNQLESIKTMVKGYVEELQSVNDEEGDVEYKDTPIEDRINGRKETTFEMLERVYEAHGDGWIHHAHSAQYDLF